MSKNIIMGVLLILVLGLLGYIFLIGPTGKLTKEIDSDNDGLNDEKEIQFGTDPDNPNTDGDRYLDGEDRDPLKKNSAEVRIYVSNKDWDWGPAITNTLLSILKIGGPSSETVIADAEVELFIINEGDDYTEFVNYDVLFEAAGVQLTSLRDSLGKLDIGEGKTRVYQKQILLKDIPDLVYNSLIIGNIDWDIKIENLNYKKFE